MQHLRAFGLCLISSSVLALACSDDTTAIPSETSSTGADETSASSTGESTGSTDGETTDPGTETGLATETGEPASFCGDGVLDPGEECDDGNMADGDGCDSACVSACGAEFWLDINAEAGWFDVLAIRPGPAPEAVTLAGGLTFDDDTPGRLRVATYADQELVSAIESPALGSAGTAALPQTHVVSSVSLTEAGDVLALGVSTEVLVEGQEPVTRYWLGRHAADDLSVVWRVELPLTGPDADFRPRDLAALANGDAIVTMTSEVAAADDDILVVRRSYADGGEVWAAGLSGEFNGGWSLDSAGQVAVGAGDRLWAAGIIRVDWQTFEVNLFELDPNDGATLWSDVPLADPGNAHEQLVFDLSAGPDGYVALGVGVLGPAFDFSYGAAFAYQDGQPLWSLLPEQLPWDEGQPYVAPRVAVDADGDVLVSGTYTHSFNFATASRPWFVAVAPDGTMLCNARVGMPGEAGVVPRNGFAGGGRGLANVDTYGNGGMGPGSDGNWLVGVRGW